MEHRADSPVDSGHPSNDVVSVIGDVQTSVVANAHANRLVEQSVMRAAVLVARLLKKQ